MDHGELIPGPHKSNMRVFGIDFVRLCCVPQSLRTRQWACV